MAYPTNGYYAMMVNLVCLDKDMWLLFHPFTTAGIAM